jgi:hypothetical protein
VPVIVRIVTERGAFMMWKGLEKSMKDRFGENLKGHYLWSEAPHKTIYVKEFISLSDFE